MSSKRSGLGRNLSALLSTSVSASSIEPSVLPIASLQPGKFQPRGVIEAHALEELSASIKKQGLLQPIVVREIAPSRYEIIAGERRWRACQLADLIEIPVVVRQVDDETALAMALVENLQREDLNPMDQARAMQRLVKEFDFTHEHIATLLSKSRTAVSNYLRLLNLSAEVSSMLEKGILEMGHARALLSLSDSEQLKLASLVAEKKLSVRQTEALVTRMKQDVPQTSIEMKALLANHFYQTAASLAKQWQTPVKLKPGKSGSGKIEIHYQDPNQLKQLMTYFKAFDRETVS